jgi:hypothetical protein
MRTLVKMHKPFPILNTEDAGSMYIRNFDMPLTDQET